MTGENRTQGHETAIDRLAGLARDVSEERSRLATQVANIEAETKANKEAFEHVVDSSTSLVLKDPELSGAEKAGALYALTRSHTPAQLESFLPEAVGKMRAIDELVTVRNTPILDFDFSKGWAYYNLIASKGEGIEVEAAGSGLARVNIPVKVAEEGSAGLGYFHRPGSLNEDYIKAFLNAEEVVEARLNLYNILQAPFYSHRHVVIGADAVSAYLLELVNSRNTADLQPTTVDKQRRIAVRIYRQSEQLGIEIEKVSPAFGEWVHEYREQAMRSLGVGVLRLANENTTYDDPLERYKVSRDKDKQEEMRRGLGITEEQVYEEALRQHDTRSQSIKDILTRKDTHL